MSLAESGLVSRCSKSHGFPQEVHVRAGRPGGVSGFPRACYLGQFREFEFRRVHTRMNSRGLFLAHKLTCGKRESV